MSKIRTVKPLLSRRIAKALKPRNPMLVALKASQGARGAGAHGKKRGSLRRAENMAMAAETAARKG